MNFPIYMDNNATTPVDSRVLERMLPFFSEQFGNAASKAHRYGWVAAEAVRNARCQVARLINATISGDPDEPQAKEIIWTSGATEADNLAIKGVAEACAYKGNHIITCQTEHKAVLDTCKALEGRGIRVTYLPVDRFGMLDLDDLRKAIGPDTILISIMAANNETGVIHPIRQIGRIAREAGVPFHCDATQAFGKIPLDVEEMQIDLMSASAHKIYGPKGVGVLYVRRRHPKLKRIKVAAQVHGGGHERRMRSGTINVPGVVGFGAAAELSGKLMTEDAARLTELRDRLFNGLRDRLPDVFLNGHPTERMPNTANISFAYVEGEGLMTRLMDDLCASSGSACTSESLQPSHVLAAMNVTDELSHTAIRFSMGRFNTPQEVDYLLERVPEEVRFLRDMSPLYDMAKEGLDLSAVDWGKHEH